jgi:hypothetical protein
MVRRACHRVISQRESIREVGSLAGSRATPHDEWGCPAACGQRGIGPHSTYTTCMPGISAWIQLHHLYCRYLQQNLLHHCAACGPSKLNDRPKDVLSSTFWQVAVEKVPRTCPTELYSTGTRIARSLVLRPRSRPPGQIPGVCLATSYADAVWSDSERRPCCLPAAELVPSFLPKTFFIMAALSSSRLPCTFRSLPEPHPPWD